MNYTNQNERPKPLKPRFENIPNDLQALKQWVLWKYIWKWSNDDRTEGSWTKIPFGTNGSTASSTNPLTWATFDSVKMTFSQQQNTYDGIGFVFTSDNDIIGVDLDHCLTTEYGHAQLSPFALRVCEKLQTYGEVSPSMTGMHLIGRAKDIELVRKKIVYQKNEIEVYKEGRYFTFTGYTGSPALPIADIKTNLGDILRVITPKEPTAKEPNPQPATASDFTSLSVEARLRMALKNEKTKRWFDGDKSDFGGDDSRADLALCRSLAFFSDGNRDTLDAMFRQSKLMRAKWDERRGNDTYGNITIAKVLSTQESYADFVNLKAKQPSDFDTRKTRRLSVNDMWDLAMEYRRSGEAQGVRCGWDSFSELYRPAKGQLTVVTGSPGSGKSTFLDVYCYQLARLHDWKFTFASFETLPLQRHILNFAQIATMKPTYVFAENHATDEEMEEAREFLNDHFHFLNPSENDFTMDNILEYVADDIKEYNIDGFVLDTFTELDEPNTRNETETQLIKRVLKKQQRFTQQNNIHSWTVAHPAKSKENYVNGRPGLGSIAGSQNFWNKIDFGIVVDRPDRTNNITKVYVDKVRFDINGKEGECEFTYDKAARHYTPTNHEVSKVERNWGF